MAVGDYAPSFGNGLMQGFSFVEGIYNARALRDERKQRLEWDAEDRKLAAEDRTRLLERQDDTDLANRVAAHAAGGGDWDTLDPQVRRRYLQRTNRAAGDRTTEVVDEQDNGDGTFTPIVSGVDINGNRFERKPMTEGAVPVAQGGKPIKIKKQAGLDNALSWAAQFSTQAVPQIADRRKRAQDETAAGKMAEVTTEAAALRPSSVAPGLPGPGNSAPGTMDYATVRARQLEVESNNRNYNPDSSVVTSGAGARYASQVMPGTAGDPGFGVRPAQADTPAEWNRVGDEYMAAMWERYDGDKNPALALAAYNAGPGSVDRALKRAQEAGEPEAWMKYLPKPQETIPYVNAILGTTVAPVQAAAAPAAAEPPRRGINVSPIPAAQADTAGGPMQPRSPIGNTLGGGPLGTGYRLAKQSGVAPAIGGAEALYELGGRVDAARRGFMNQARTNVTDVVTGVSVASRWSGIDPRAVVSDPVRYLDRWIAESGDIPAAERVELQKPLLAATLDKVGQLRDVALAGGPDARKATAELKRISGKLNELKYSTAEAVGLPDSNVPGRELADKVAGAPPPVSKPSAGRARAATTQVARASDQNRGSERPRLSARTIDNISWLVAHGYWTPEQGERMMLTGYLEKGEITPVDPTKDIIRVTPDGRLDIIQRGTPDPAETMKLEQKLLAAKTKAQAARNRQHLSRLDAFVGNTFKDKRMGEDFRSFAVQSMVRYGSDLARIGLRTTNPDGALDVGDLDESRFDVVLNAMYKGWEEQRKFGDAWWITRVVRRARGTEPQSPVEFVPREQPRGRTNFDRTAEYLQLLADEGDAEAIELLGGGEEAIRAYMAEKGYDPDAS